MSQPLLVSCNLLQKYSLNDTILSVIFFNEATRADILTGARAKGEGYHGR